MHCQYKCVWLFENSYTKNFMVKSYAFPKTWFSWKSDCTYNFEQSPTMYKYFGAWQFFLLQFNHLKANGPSISEHINFWSISFSIKELFSCEPSPLEFTAPKKAIYILFFGQTPHFLGEKLKTRTDNLDHWKTGSVAVILSLSVGVQHKQKVAQ